MFPHEPIPEHIGPYKILRHLSSRGSADLYLGEHVGPMGFQRTCVLKLVPAPGADDVRSAQELAHEAQICSRLNHPAIVRMHDFFEHGDRLVLVFEHFAGLSLARLLAHLRRRRMEMSDSISWYIAHQLFSALAHAHALTDEQGTHTPVVHRDVQPAHIIISNDAQVRLTGYGIAKIAGTVGDTAVGFIKGTPAYMAPEQARGETVTERVDIYAAGLVVWEMLTGQSATPAGQGRPGGELLRLISGRRVDAIMALRNDIPREIGAAVDACLEPSADKRTIKCADVERWLKKVCDVNAGREVLRERLVQMRNVSVRPPPAAGPPRVSVAPKAAESVRVQPRFPGVATRVTGRVSAAAPGASQAPTVSRRAPVRGTRSYAPPPAMAGQGDGAVEAQAAAAKARRATLLGIAPPAEEEAALKAPRVPAVQDAPAAVSARAAARGRAAAERQPLQAKGRTLGGLAPAPGSGPEAFPQVVPEPGAVVLEAAVAQPVMAAPAVASPPQLHPLESAETAAAPPRRRTGRVLIGALIGGAALALLGAGALVVSRVIGADSSSQIASASAAQADGALPPTATGSAVVSVEQPVASSEPPAPAAPVAAASPLASFDTSTIPQGYGALLAKAPPEGVIYVAGVPVGETDKVVMAPCGRRFVRVGTKLGPAGLRSVSWLSDGQSVQIACQRTTEIDATPAVPIRGNRKKTPKDPRLPWSIAPF